MSINVWPLDAVGGDPEYSGRMLRQTTGAPWGGKTPARPLGGRSGVVAGCGQPGSATSGDWTVGPHVGVLDLESLDVAGPYVYAIDADVTDALNPADGSHPRIDLISIRLDDPSEDASSVPLAEIVYTAGTAAASPTTPATPARSLALMTVHVPTSGGGDPTVAWVAPSVVAVGGITPTSVAQRPSSPYDGEYIHDPTFGTMYWDGVRWITASQHDQENYSILVGDDNVVGSVTFAQRFTSDPAVMVTGNSLRAHAVSVTNISPTGFDYRVFRTDGTAVAGTPQASLFSWHASP